MYFYVERKFICILVYTILSIAYNFPIYTGRGYALLGRERERDTLQCLTKWLRIESKIVISHQFQWNFQRQNFYYYFIRISTNIKYKFSHFRQISIYQKSITDLRNQLCVVMFFALVISPLIKIDYLECFLVFSSCIGVLLKCCNNLKLRMSLCRAWSLNRIFTRSLVLLPFSSIPRWDWFGRCGETFSKLIFFKHFLFSFSIRFWILKFWSLIVSNFTDITYHLLLIIRL